MRTKILIYLTYLAHEYFADFFKTYNRLLQFYETACLKNVLTCTPALD